jgi:hypothetical protein
VARSKTVPRGAVLAVTILLCLGLLATEAQAATPPQVIASWVTDVTSTSANLHAQVDPEGLESTYRFEYLTEAAYEANLGAGEEGFAGAATAPAGGEGNLGEEAGAVAALQHLERLAPGTAYLFRILARNAAGQAPGPLRVFETESNAPVPGEECPNSQRRIEDTSQPLPDCRAWELVSPAEKNGGSVQGFGAIAGGGVLQGAAAGAAATFSSTASFGAGAQGAPPASQYVSRRTEAGWQTQNITAPTLSGAYGADPEGVPYQLFSPDLGLGLMANGRRCGEGEECPRSYSLREAEALAPVLEAPGVRFAGAEANLVHLVFSTCAALTADATEVAGGGGGCDPADPNLYESSGGAPQLINVLPGQGEGTPGATLAAQSGAVSADGARVYWVGSGGDLYLYEAGRGKAVDTSGEAAFQVASADGSLAYYLKAGHLYRYSAASETATDLTPAGGVTGVFGASEDGSHVYYATAAGLFLWDGGATTQVAEGPEAAAPGDYPPATGTARVGADGGELVFLSKAPLTDRENTDQRTGEPDTEVFLYLAGPNSLICASCNATGERPLGPSAIPGASADGSGPGATRIYKPRVLSADGRRLFFDSADRLVARDSSAAADVYEWEAGGDGSCRVAAGCVFLISSGHSAQPSEFVDASADGADAFFLTADPLFPGDPGSVDLYDAREGGGFPVPPPPIPCEGDACQALPSPPEDPTPGTLVAGSPNPKPHFPKPHHRKPKKHKGNGSHHHKKKRGKKHRRAKKHHARSHR